MLKRLAIVIRTNDGGLRSVLYTLKDPNEIIDDCSILFKVTSKLADDLKTSERVVSITFINESEEKYGV